MSEWSDVTTCDDDLQILYITILYWVIVSHATYTEETGAQGTKLALQTLQCGWYKSFKFFSVWEVICVENQPPTFRIFGKVPVPKRQIDEVGVIVATVLFHATSY